MLPGFKTFKFAILMLALMQLSATAIELEWEIGDFAPDFTAFNLSPEGNPLPVTFYGEAVLDPDFYVVSTCAMWCTPCQLFATQSNEIVTTLAGEGIEVEVYDWIFQNTFGLDPDHTDALLWRNVFWTGNPANVWFGGNLLLSDPDSVIANIFDSNDANAIPNILILDRSFEIRAQTSGFHQESLIAIIRNLAPNLGDVNQDGQVNLLDVDPFIAVLSSGGYQFEADCNQDGAINLLDIDPFIALF